MNEEQKKVAEEFRESKWLWWINRILHTFGWVIVYHYDDITNELQYISVAKNIEFRGFGSESDDIGYEYVGKWLENNIKEANEKAKF